MQISIVAALGLNRGLGFKGKLLWRLPEDLAQFKRLTLGHPIIMGHTTFESIPNRPLSGRMNIVITRKPNWGCEGVTAVSSIKEALEEASVRYADKVFFIGGGQIYRDALPFVDTLYLTHISALQKADVFFPEYKDEFEQVESRWGTGASEDLNYRFTTYRRKGTCPEKNTFGCGVNST